MELRQSRRMKSALRGAMSASVESLAYAPDASRGKAGTLCKRWALNMVTFNSGFVPRLVDRWNRARRFINCNQLQLCIRSRLTARFMVFHFSFSSSSLRQRNLLNRKDFIACGRHTFRERWKRKRKQSRYAVIKCDVLMTSHLIIPSFDERERFTTFGAAFSGATGYLRQLLFFN